MRRMKKGEYVVSILSGDLKDLRDTLIALTGLLEASRAERTEYSPPALAITLYVEKQLSREAAKLAVRLEDEGAESSPF